MARTKRLLILLGVLAVVCVAAFAALSWEQKQEQIKTSGQVVLEIDPDSVNAISWALAGAPLSFHRDGDWVYDGDEAFPVDPEAMEELLAPFASLSAAFVIEDVEDFGQYGLDDPACTITLETEDQTYEILLGDYSAMDSQRYLSFGDGNVYLAVSDPMDQYDATLSDCILHDEIPSFDRAEQVRFSGEEAYTIYYEEDSTDTYCPEDLYYTDRDDGVLPLDTGRMEDYLSAVEFLGLTNYVTYNATEEELAQYGLDQPELSVTVDYVGTDTDGEDTSGSFTLHISRDPEEKAAAEADPESEDDTITAYARVGDSPIIYSITSLEYLDLTAAGVNDLRHREVLTAPFADIQSIDVSLEGSSYAFTAQGSGEDRTWHYGDREIEIEGFQSAVEGLSITEFTNEPAEQQLEVAFTVHLDSEIFPQVEVELYRCDGTSCLAVLDGDPLGLVARSDAVELMEAIREIVLQSDTEEST